MSSLFMQFCTNCGMALKQSEFELCFNCQTEKNFKVLNEIVIKCRKNIKESSDEKQ